MYQFKDHDFVIFPCTKNPHLARMLWERAILMGYKNLTDEKGPPSHWNSITLTKAGHIASSGDCDDLRPYHSHVYGDMTKFLYSDFYSRKKDHQEVVLNDKYTAVVYKTRVVVGCQEFPISKLQELVDAYKSLS